MSSFDVTRLRDALYNLHEDSGASEDYGRGCLIGAISGMMACAFNWQEAWAICMKALPKGFRRECIPQGYECYVVVVHRPTGDQYVLNRAYLCMTSKPVRGFSIENPVETWEGYSVLSTPDWAKQRSTAEFTAYWMY